MCIVMEYMTLGSLHDVLHNELIPDIPFSLKLKLAIQTAKGMLFLHESGIAHMDLKSLNVLIDSKWNPKISDFGLSTLANQKARSETICGSVHWTSPELLAEMTNVDFLKADVYAFGVILWELLTRMDPFEGMSPALIAVCVIKDDIRPTLRDDYVRGDNPYIDLMMLCWDRDPDIRPTFGAICSKLLPDVIDQNGMSDASLVYATNENDVLSAHSSSSSHSPFSSRNTDGRRRNIQTTASPRGSSSLRDKGKGHDSSHSSRDRAGGSAGSNPYASHENGHSASGTSDVEQGIPLDKLIEKRRNEALQEEAEVAKTFEVISKAGNGSFGVVWKARRNDEIVAVKIIERRTNRDTSLDEVRILENINHPNVVSYKGSTFTSLKAFIFTEFAEMGSLHQVLHNATISMSPDEKVAILRGVAKGIACLHNAGIIHRDLKSSNILVFDKWNVKVADVGLATAKEQNSTKTALIGTPCWTAPETMCVNPRYDEKSDIYSFAIICWEVLTRKKPYEGMRVNDICLWVLQGRRPPINRNRDYDERIASLIEDCWKPKPEERPTMDDILMRLGDETSD